MQKTILLSIAFLVAISSFSQTYVNEYYKSNGTYVEGYYRSSPNSTKSDNWSTYGNINPYTGSVGTKTYSDYNNYNSNYSTQIYNNEYLITSYSNGYYSSPYNNTSGYYYYRY